MSKLMMAMGAKVNLVELFQSISSSFIILYLTQLPSL